MTGEFTAKIYRGGKLRYESPVTKNIFVDNAFVGVTDLDGFIHVGTSGTVPQTSDTALFAFLASKEGDSVTADADVLDGTDYIKSFAMEYTFALGAVVGTIAELGMALASSGAVFTRALFKDGVGDPTTLTITADDQLVINYIVKKSVSMVPIVSSVDLNGDTINFTIHPYYGGRQAAISARFPNEMIDDPKSSSNAPKFSPCELQPFSINPTTYVPTLLNNIPSTDSSTPSKDNSQQGVIEYTSASGITQANFEWRWAVLNTATTISVSHGIAMIEFTGPNYVDKLDTDIITFKWTESSAQA